MIQKLFSRFRTNLISGLLALAPLAAVVWVMAWFLKLLLNFKNALPQGLNPRVLFGIESPNLLWLLDWAETFVVLFVLVIGIAIFGMVSRNILGMRILRGITKFVNRIPVLRTIYSTLEQLLETFGGTTGRSFSKVVLIEYPRKGIYSLALVTGEREINPLTGAKEPCFNIFIPTTPNPTSGFYLTVPATDVKVLDMTVEDALKQIISMGIVQ